MALSRAQGWKRSVLYFGILMPLLTSAVVRTFGWMILLANNGFINQTLIASGLTNCPIRLMYNQLGVVPRFRKFCCHSWCLRLTPLC